jgi:hypothetical protein
VLLIRLLWGENLRWEQNPNPESGDGKSLWCDLKPDSWPTRSWYAHYDSGSWFAFLTKEEPLLRPASATNRLGKYLTWGGTTLGHGGFYGPGAANLNGWGRTQEHEHVHVEQFEATMLRSFAVGLYNGGTVVVLGHVGWGVAIFLFNWWVGYLWMGIYNGLTARLRGENAYRGSVHEEEAYDIGDAWKADEGRDG